MREPMNKNRVRGGLGRTSEHQVAKSISIKGPERKRGGCAQKVVGITPGDLPSCPDRGLSEPRGEPIARQKSAEGT